MAEIDEFAAGLLEEAKRFLERAQDTTDAIAINANLHAALMIGFGALEAHINAVCEEVSVRPELSIHEAAFILEKDVGLNNAGEFVTKNVLKMTRIEDRILFLHRRFSQAPLDKSQTWWGALMGALDLRNKLTHPKDATPITVTAIASALQAIIDALNALYQAVYNRPFPSINRGLNSLLSF